MSETPKEGSEGYAEEQPDEVAGGEGESRRRDSGEGGESPPSEADRGDDGQATGNPRSS